jgi:hypothetical protein
MELYQIASSSCTFHSALIEGGDTISSSIHVQVVLLVHPRAAETIARPCRLQCSVVLLHSLLSFTGAVGVKFPSHRNVNLSLRALIAGNIFYSHSFDLAASATAHEDSRVISPRRRSGRLPVFARVAAHE